MVAWGKNIGDKESGEIEYHFQYPHPLDATLWFYDGEWILDLAWMNGGFKPGKAVEQSRHRMSGTKGQHQKAKTWASALVREVIDGKTTRGNGESLPGT